MSSTKTMKTKILALVLSILMLLTMIPAGVFIEAFAATPLPEYTVLFKNTKDEVDTAFSDVDVTLTNIFNEKETYTVQAIDGKASFKNSVSEDEIYKLTVAKKIGYALINPRQVAVSASATECEITTTPLEQVELTGIVKDETKAGVGNITVQCSGYETKETKTDASGKYTFTVYADQDYTITAVAPSEKHSNATSNIKINSSTQCDLQFAIKTFEIATNPVENGTVTPTASVEYGSEKVVEAVANDGYRIESYKVDGVEQSAAKGEKKYTHTFLNITEAHTVEVSFIRQTYKITFTVGENGTVTYNDGTAQDVAGGSVNIEKIFNESTDPKKPTKVTITATPNEGYYIKNVEIDLNSKKIKNNQKYQETVTMNENHSFVVEFSPNQYKVTATTSKPKQGSVQFLDSNGQAVTGESLTVSHGSSATLKITPNEDFDLISLKAGKNSLDLQEVDWEKVTEKDGYYIFALENITQDTQISVEFKKIEKKEVTNKIDNEYYTITLPESCCNIDDKYYINNNESIKISSKKYSRVNINWSKEPKDTGKTIEIKQKQNEISKLINAIYVSEKAVAGGWLYKIPVNIEIIFDGTGPAIAGETELWTNGETNREYSFTVSDEESGVKAVYYSTDKNPDEKTEINGTGGTYTFTPNVEAEGEYHYYITAVDNCGNVTKKQVSVTVDKTAPKITAFKYSTSETSAEEDFIKFLTFGTVSSKSIYVTVTGADEEGITTSGLKTSDLKEITLYKGSDVFKTKETTENTATFELTEAAFKNGAEISATVTDIAGNVSNNTKPTDEGVTTKAKNNTVKIDTAKPEATIQPDEAVYTDGDGKLWYNGNTALNIVATDNNAGICSVEIKLNGKSLEIDAEGKAINTDFSAAYTTSEKFVINTAQNAVDGENVIEVIVTNNAGVQSETKIQKVYIDTTAPDITNFEVTRVGGKALDKILNFLTFGIFFNDQVEVTVTAADSNATSGVKTITLFAGEKEFETKNVENDKVTFVIPTDAVTDETKHFDAVISAKATDNTGNTTQTAVEPNTENSNVKNSGLMIETIKPTIDVAFPEAVTDKNTNTATAGDWYNSDVKFAITANDADSGLRNVCITINNKELVNDDLPVSEKITSKEYSVNTADAVSADDGSYTLNVSVTDNAGNVKEYTKTIYKDTSAPSVTQFEFSPVGNSEGQKAPVTSEDYGFYFQEDTTVTIAAKDEAPSAGIKSITYYTVDKNGKIDIPETTALVNAENQISFVIPKDFKGQIFAKATDNVDNTPAEYVHPSSAVIESPEQHEKDVPHITFVKESTEYKQNNGVELYAKDVPVQITVADTYSGIRDITWSVVAPYDIEKNQNGKIVIANDGSITGDSDWKVQEKDINLVTKISKDIVVTNNSNDIEILVTMHDRAGNESTETITLGIDKTTPVIEVTYDNNTPDEEYTSIYKENRKATIKVTERNFTADDIVYLITNTDGVIPALSEWTEFANQEKPDETYYLAEILYDVDGDYTFDISYKDLACNEASAVAQHVFTIDKTIPLVQVTYDNMDALNKNYFKADRIATITIQEHNFDASRVNVIGTATDNGNPSVFPALSAWTNNGDTHVATIHYNADSKYSFDIEFLDMAGNSIVDFAAEEFYVDKTAPNIEISGVADKSANNNRVAPNIICTDTNFTMDTVQISLSGVNNGKVQYNSAITEIENGQKLEYSDFKHEQAVDDIYTLAVALEDRAGNKTTKTISFSVNRFGSVYDMTGLNDVIGKFLQTERDIVFTETNVDAINADTVKIKLNKNGTPTDLVEGRDYTVSSTGGNGQWSKYTYTILKKLFQDDAKYSVSVYSVDAAGNINENIDESKKAEISFGVDKTKPVIVPVNFESNKQYNEETKTVSIEIKDNLVLQEVKIYLNDQEVEYKVEGNTYSFQIPEARGRQVVKVVTVDAAGNTEEIIVEDFVVSTNFFVRWYNNTPAFIGSIVGATLLVALIIFLVVFKKKKKEEE